MEVFTSTPEKLADSCTVSGKNWIIIVIDHIKPISCWIISKGSLTFLKGTNHENTISITPLHWGGIISSGNIKWNIQKSPVSTVNTPNTWFSSTTCSCTWTSKSSTSISSSRTRTRTSVSCSLSTGCPTSTPSTTCTPSSPSCPLGNISPSLCWTALFTPAWHIYT